MSRAQRLSQSASSREINVDIIGALAIRIQTGDCAAKLDRSISLCADALRHTLRAANLPIGPNIDFDLARHFDDSVRMKAILDQRVFERLSAVNKYAAKNAILFAGNPVAATIPAEKDGRRCGATRRRSNLHNHDSSMTFGEYAPSANPSQIHAAAA
ncbi:hypothetical protein [Bradyrhizobium sp. CB3481]|uniref:hypothetical protein n=1 Tax=Bradyrhizobium sp. CB3481 TaxID=3039158 RepID=UPI0032C232AE